VTYKNPAIAWLKAHGIALTRDAYSALCGGDPEGPEDEWPLLLVGGTDLEEEPHGKT
jgi:hypothetical protein